MCLRSSFLVGISSKRRQRKESNNKFSLKVKLVFGQNLHCNFSLLICRAKKVVEIKLLPLFYVYGISNVPSLYESSSRIWQNVEQCAFRIVYLYQTSGITNIANCVININGLKANNSTHTSFKFNALRFGSRAQRPEDYDTCACACACTSASVCVSTFYICSVFSMYSVLVLDTRSFFKLYTSFR